MLAISEALARAYQYLRTGSFAQAEQLYRQVLQVDPANAQVWFWLGAACQGQAKHAEAAGHYRHALRLRPEFVEAHSNLGVVQATQGQLAEAVASFRKALRINPRCVEALNGLGTALHAQGQWVEAEMPLRQALRLKPDFAEAHYNLGNTLHALGILDEAGECFRSATQFRPTDAKAHANFGSIRKEQGRLDEAIAAYRQALALRPDNARVHSNLLFALLHSSRPDPDEVFAEHRRWAAQHAEPLAGSIRPQAGDRQPERRLRIGYLSPDFHQHVIAAFMEPVLAAHDHERFEITGYADVARPDAVTRRLQGYVDRWRSLVGWSDEAAAQLIRQDGIDILIDLAGHTARNRLLVFARKPAPIQATYLGYPATTGLGTVDYRITDAWIDPPGMTEAYYTEQLVRLPRSALIFQPADRPELKPAPALETGYVTFGFFNKLAKLNPAVLSLWSRILAALPRARLVVKVGDTAQGKQYLREALDRAGIARERVTCLGRAVTQSDYLKLYHGVDLCLDSFPFPGITTTCDALWMGVPVLTLAGRTSVARHGVSLLGHLGLDALVAASADEYMAIAVRLGGDLGRLQTLRESLGERMRATHRSGAPLFTRSLEAAYRRMWEAWCAGSHP